MEHFGTTVALIGIVIIVASLLSGALERSGLPLVAVFLALGAILGPPGLGLVDMGFDSPALRVLATLGLALVLFSDAVSLDMSDIRKRKQLVWRVLGPGTVVPAIIVASAARWLLGLSWPAATILGAALASTDPVLLRSILRSPALPATPRTALRLETGMNDVVLLPVIVLSMLMITPAGAVGSGVTASDITRSAIGLFLLGPALGALVGWLGIIVLIRVRSSVGVRRDYESLYALGLAFTGYAAAEAVGGSGFLAAFAAGFMVAAQDVELCDCFLEYGEATAEMLLLLTFVAFGTSLIWTGFDVIDARTLLFAGIALATRTIVLYPVLSGLHLSRRDHRVIALFGPRGLSSLLFALLPVFAGIPGAERLFAVTALVVMLSVLLHGGGIALFLRSNSHSARVAADITRGSEAESAEVAPRGGSPDGIAIAEDGATAERITVDELREMRGRNEDAIIVDARAARSYRVDPRQAAGAVRVNPDEPVRDATALRLSQHATLVVYCA